MPSTSRLFRSCKPARSNRTPWTVLLLAIFSGCSISAIASPITYTLNGTFSGSLGLTPFTSTPGTITLIGNTSGTASLGGGYYTNTSGISSITLQGVGTALFLSSSFGAISSTDSAGFFDTANSFGTGLYDPLLGAYALTAPFSHTAYLLTSSDAANGVTELTDLGALSLTGDDGSSATFTAMGSGTSPAATPEPQSLTLVATGLLSLSGLTRLRKPQPNF